MAKELILHSEKERCSVLTEGLHLKALASVRARSGPQAWEVSCLSLATDIGKQSTELLEGLCILAGEGGGQRVFLRLPATSPLLGLAREAGFISCVHETLYRKEATLLPPYNTAKFIRPFTTKDEYQTFRLYNECVPARVKLEYALTFDEWRDALEPSGKSVQQGVYEDGGCVRGWVRVGSGRRSANRLEIMVHPQEETGVWQGLVSWGLHQGNPEAPFLALIPDHQSSLALILEKKGFVRVGQYHLLVKSTSVRVKESALAPVNA